MSNFSELFTGGAAGFYNQLLIADSRTYTTVSKGKYLITVIGGGGGGRSGSANARGGGAGGMCQSILQLGAGTNLNIVIGAGGSATANTDGGNGGTSSVEIVGLTLMTAQGGIGGKTTGASLGGSASGGNVRNIAGGNAGDLNLSGGGAVGVYGIGHSSTTAIGAGTGSPTGASILSGTTNFNVDPAGQQRGFSDSFIGSRFLLPCGSISTTSAAFPQNPGVGGNGSRVNGGMYAGGYSPTGAVGGNGGFGGGGGGGAIVGQTGGLGGQGCVIIEWIEF